MNRPDVSGFAINQRCVCPAQRVSATGRWRESNSGSPLVDETPVLARRHRVSAVHPAWKEPITPLQVLASNPSCDRRARLLSDFELYSRTRLALDTRARVRTWSPCITSSTRKWTKSQPRNLLSMAKFNSARSRTRADICKRTRIAQTSPGLSGGFWPVTFPLFQGTNGSCDRSFNIGARTPSVGLSGYILREVIAYYPSPAERTAMPVRRLRLDGGVRSLELAGIRREIPCSSLQESIDAGRFWLSCRVTGRPTSPKPR